MIQGAVTLEKLCYIKVQLNRAPCFNESGFGELQREYLIYLSKICVINLEKILSI